MLQAGGPANRRAELWHNMKSVLEEGRFELPDSDSLQADLISPGYKYDSAGRLLIETLDELGNPAGGFVLTGAQSCGRT